MFSLAYERVPSSWKEHSKFGAKLCAKFTNFPATLNGSKTSQEIKTLKLARKRNVEVPSCEKSHH